MEHQDYSIYFKQASDTIMACACEISTHQTKPSVLFKPRIFIDGDKWCALYGENIQDGVAGFGDSPEEAMGNFDDEWKAKQ